MQAGFDGAEVHSANGYLLEQFLRDSINDRNDACGGSIAHRARLLPEVVQAVSDEVGAARTGLRLHRALSSTMPDRTATRRRCSTLWSNSSTR